MQLKISHLYIFCPRPYFKNTLVVEEIRTFYVIQRRVLRKRTQTKIIVSYNEVKGEEFHSL